LRTIREAWLPMPFILQCPYCTKYMILEDEQRGCRVRCLIPACARLIDQEPSDSGEKVPAGKTGARPAAAAPPPLPARAPAPTRAPNAAGDSAVLVAERQRIVQCPACKTHLRVPASDRSQAIRCAKCQNVFQA
jgi:predicted Zn finger-like uncharacterized protein